MEKDLDKAISILCKGGVIAHATDTCYGFVCDALSEAPLSRLYQLKKMPKSKPVSLMVSDLAEASRYGFFNKNAMRLAKKYWPGPLTIIVKRKKTLPAFLNSENKTVGFRVPKHKLSIQLVKKFRRPLTTTSANISGLPSPYSVNEINKQFKKEKLKPDFIIDSGRLKKNLPSTIVDCSGKKMKLIRQGEVIALSC